MWTYRHPYKPLEISGEYIEDRAKIALSRALNINRLIVFAGSGLSAAYDQMSWGDLVQKALDVAQLESGKETPAVSPRDGIQLSAPKQSALRTIRRLKTHKSKIESANASMLEVVEELERLSDNQEEFRKALAIEFGKPQADLRQVKEDRLNKDIGDKDVALKEAAKPLQDLLLSDLERCDPIKTLINQIGIRRFVTVNYDVEIERCFERVFRVRGAGKRNSRLSDFQRLCRGVSDPLNEMKAEDKQGDPKNEEPGSWNNGKTKSDGAPLMLDDHVEYRDGTTRSVSSVCLSGNNIGELVNFSMFSSQYVSQVFHLHGRYDKPESHMLTEADYQRRYFRTDENKRAFEEAFSNLFSGNDVLFVGLGMGEEDLLRPLRHFLSNDHTPDYAKRHVFALMPRKVTLDSDFFVPRPSDKLVLAQGALAERQHSLADFETKLKELGPLEASHLQTDNARILRTPVEESSSDQNGPRRDILRDLIKRELKAIKALESKIESFEAERAGDAQQFCVQNFEGHQVGQTNSSGSASFANNAFQQDAAFDENRQLELKSKYGVYTIYFGGQDYRTLLLLCALISKVTESSKDLLPPLDRLRVLSAFKGLIGRLEAAAEESEKNPPTRRFLLSPEEFRQVQALAKYCKTQFKDEGHVSKAIQPTIKALSTRVKSLALDQELSRIEERRSKWWRDWCTRPEERRAKFAPVRLKDGPHERRCMARHQAYYKALPENHVSLEETAGEARSCFEVIEQLRGLARHEPIIAEVKDAGAAPKRSLIEKPRNEDFSVHNQRLGSRILRATMARGSGKGSLFHLLTQEIPKRERALIERGHEATQVLNSEDHLFLDTLFEQDPRFRYASSFVLHLSYSMEFSSIISALADFFENAIVVALSTHITDVLDVLKGLSDLNPHDEGMLRIKELLGAESHQLKVLEDFSGLIKGSISPDNQNDYPYKELLKEFFDSHTPLFGPGRVHRLERMRIRMQVYTYLADILPKKNLRLFIGMSGLDKLCNEKGTAYNPMYRALFRILTGCGQKYKHEADLMIPLDVFLLSGTDIPLRYLTEEWTKDQVEEKLSRSAPLSGQYASYFEFREIEANTYLKVWPSLPSLSLGERYWTKTANGSDFSYSTLELELLKSRNTPVAHHSILNPDGDGYSSGRDPSFNRKYGAILRQLEGSVALHAWCEGVWAQAIKLGEKSDDEIGAWLKTLDAAASSGGAQMVVEEIMALHRTTLRQGTISRPDGSIGQARVQFAGEGGDCKNLLTELLYVVLAQLALFPMPVELRVLYGCPQIRELLHRIDEALLGSAEDATGNRPTDRNAKRSRSLEWLHAMMNYMHDSSLVIKVKRKLSGEPLLDAPTPAQDMTFSRYIIQHQLRDFAAKEMDLSVPDQGEHNYFQVSIYPDQPRDLPTPRQDHYEMVLDIFETQIRNVRNTLWCLFQVEKLLRDLSVWDNLEEDAPPDVLDRLNDDMLELLENGLRRRLLKDDPDDEGSPLLRDEIASIQATSQRVRALYGMLRSGFTAGTISRLSQIETAGEPDQPYERFRGWLRGLTNAAVGIDEVQNTLYLLTGVIPEGREAEFEDLAERVEAWSRRLENDSSPKGRLAKLIRQIFIHEPVSNEGDEQSTDKSTKGQAALTLPPKPLYRDEIGWLLNERGLLSLLQGHVFDAIPLFNRALNVMYHQGKEAGNDPALHAAVRRVRFNRALALILRGHIQRAKNDFEALILPDDIAAHSGSQISWLSKGYIHLCNYYSGDISKAYDGYLRVIENAQQRGIMRLASIFHRHAANLLIRKQHFETALNHVKLAIGSAEQSEQRDVLHFANITLARLQISEQTVRAGETSSVLMDARTYGRNMGIPRLEALAMRSQADLFLLHSDRDSAGELSSLAAAISNRSGLRLEKLQALATFSEVLINRGQGALAGGLLDEIGRDAERHDFQLISGRVRSLVSAVRRAPSP